MTVTAAATRPDLAELIEQLVDWSEPDRRGICHTYPEQPFWRMWRTDKAAMKNAGVRVRRRDGRWTATWDRQPATVGDWLEGLAYWSPPRMIVTHRGPSMVRNAVPDERLWTQWRHNRKTLKRPRRVRLAPRQPMARRLVSAMAARPAHHRSCHRRGTGPHPARGARTRRSRIPAVPAGRHPTHANSHTQPAGRRNGPRQN